MLSKYDEWRLSGPDERPEIGTGEMVEMDGVIWCDTCGAICN